MVQKTSPILLRKFIECIFIVTDIKIKTKNIFCDILFDGKIQYTNQVKIYCPDDYFCGKFLYLD